MRQAIVCLLLLGAAGLAQAQTEPGPRDAEAMRTGMCGTLLSSTVWNCEAISR